VTRQTGFLLTGWVVLKGDLSDIVFLSLFLFLFLTKRERERDPCFCVGCTEPCGFVVLDLACGVE